MQYMLTIDNLIKKYKHFQLGPINLTIPCGEVLGLFGKNGAGKTTLINLLVKNIKPQKGSFNFDYSICVGFKLASAYSYEEMTVSGNFIFFQQPHT